MKKLFGSTNTGFDASITSFASLVFSTKFCCVAGYWLAASIGLVGLGLSHWFLESFFKSLAISGLTFSIFQTTRNLIWCHKNWRKANWRLASFHTGIVMIVAIFMTPNIISKTSAISSHKIGQNQLKNNSSLNFVDPVCGPDTQNPNTKSPID